MLAPFCRGIIKELYFSLPCDCMTIKVFILVLLSTLQNTGEAFFKKPPLQPELWGYKYFVLTPLSPYTPQKRFSRHKRCLWGSRGPGDARQQQSAGLGAPLPCHLCANTALACRGLPDRPCAGRACRGLQQPAPVTRRRAKIHLYPPADQTHPLRIRPQHSLLKGRDAPISRFAVI